MENIEKKMKSLLSDDSGNYQIVKTERFNLKNMIEHIYSGHVDLQDAQDLKQYLNNAKGNKIEIVYDVPKIGRLTPNIIIKGEKKFIRSQQGQWAVTKYKVCRDIYDDIDIVNCASTLIEQYMEIHDLETDKIKEFNEKREMILKRLMKHNNITRSEAKKYITEMLFDSQNGIQKKLEKFKIPKCLFYFIEQILNNRNELLNLYPQFTEYAIKRHGKDYYNIQGSAFAYFFQTLERHCLIAMNQYFQNNNIEVGALIHDGCHIIKRKDNNKHLSKCEDFIFNQTGFKVQLIIKPFKQPEHLENVIHFNTLDDVQPQRVTKKEINTRYLTKLNDNDEEGYELSEELKEDYINLIKSYTGSGKTQLIKNYINKNKHLSVLSLVSRVSLADLHCQELKLSSYLEVNQHSLNEVYQLDSIDKVNGIDNYKYVLIIDEIASLCAHFLNHMNKMTQVRLLLVQKLAYLINHSNCKMIIGVDANINQGTVNFLTSLTNRKVDLYINNYVMIRKTPINNYDNKFCLLKATIDLLNRGENVFLCSNMNDEFKRSIVHPILEETKLNKEDYLLYSGDEGERKINTKEWKNKRLIIATPTIIYGCDSNHSFHVVGFYFNAPHFDALDINQQLNRERKPKSINIYLADMYSKPYESINQARKEGTLDIQIKSTLRNRNEYDLYIKALENILFYEDYRKSHQLNIKHHVLDLLRSKGYTNINHITDKQKSYGQTKREEYNNILIESFENNTMDNKKLEDVIEKMEYFRIEYDSEILTGKAEINPELKETYLDIINNHLDVFIDRKKYEDLKKYIKFKYKKNDELDVNLNYTIDNGDIMASITKTDQFKIQLLKQLKNILNLEDGEEVKSVNTKNYDETIKINQELMDSIIKAFRIRSKTPIGNRRVDLTSFYMSKMKSLLGSSIDTRHKNKTIKRNKQKFTFSINTWNDKTIETFEKIINFKKKYNKAKVNDYNEYQFEQDQPIIIKSINKEEVTKNKKDNKIIVSLN